MDKVNPQGFLGIILGSEKRREDGWSIGITACVCPGSIKYWINCMQDVQQKCSQECLNQTFFVLNTGNDNEMHKQAEQV